MFTLIASLLLAPAFARADDNLKSACTTIARLVQAYPQFNLTVPSSCNEWLMDDKKECVKLQANLRIGDRGERVRALHTLLVRAGYGPFTSDEFSEKTAEAVVGFQEQYRSEVLAPYGLSRGTGFVGVSTRAKLNALFSCATSTTGTISFLRITSAPSTLKVNEVGTWKLGVTTPYSSNYSVTVTWGDEISTATAITSTNTTTFTHSYSATGTYSVIFRLSSGGQTQTVTSIIDVETGDTTERKITVISPNGGESWQVEETRTISWNAEKAGEVSLWLNPNIPCIIYIGVANTCPLFELILIARNVSSQIGANSYVWNITDTQNRQVSTSRSKVVGRHYLQVCTDAGLDGWPQNCDKSNNPFSILAQNSTNRAPSITSISGPSSLSVGTTGTWEMRASDPEGKRLTYSILWGDDAARDTQLVAEIRGASSAQTTNFTHSYSRAGTYTVRITVSDQLGAYAVSTITVVVQ